MSCFADFIFSSLLIPHFLGRQQWHEPWLFYELWFLHLCRGHTDRKIGRQILKQMCWL